MNPRTASVMAPVLVAAALLTSIGSLLEKGSSRSPVFSDPVRAPGPPAERRVFPATPGAQSAPGGPTALPTDPAEPTVATAAGSPADPAGASPTSAPPTSPPTHDGEPTGVTSPSPVANRVPDCSDVSASTSRLWPSNHKLQPVALRGGADPDGHPMSLAVTSVTQDEPVDGNTWPDAAFTSSPAEVLVRAERSGTGDGRVYRLSFTATDALGGTCGGVTSVGVPLKKNGAAGHSGKEFNSLVP